MNSENSHFVTFLCHKRHVNRQSTFPQATRKHVEGKFFDEHSPRPTVVSLFNFSKTNSTTISRFVLIYGLEKGIKLSIIRRTLGCYLWPTGMESEFASQRLTFGGTFVMLNYCVCAFFDVIRRGFFACLLFALCRSNFVLAGRPEIDSFAKLIAFKLRLIELITLIDDWRGRKAMEGENHRRND